MRTCTITSAALLLLLSVQGCGTPDKGPGKAAQDAAAPDPVEASSLRERALHVLETLGQGSDAQVRANAVEAAGLAPARLGGIVKRGLQDPTPGVRAVAAMTVGRAGLHDLCNAVRPLAADPSPFVQSAAIFALLKCGQEIDRTPLATMLFSDPSNRVRSQAAFVLGDLGDTSAIPLLARAAAEHPAKATADDIEARLLQLQISEALVKLGDSSQLSPIRAALYPSRPEDLEATALAVQILGQVQDRGAVDQLIYLSAQKDKGGRMMPAEVRLGVAAALAQMGLKQGDFIADEYLKSSVPALRAQVAHVYGETGKASNFGKVARLMDDPEGIVRVAAAAAVLRIGAGER